MSLLCFVKVEWRIVNSFGKFWARHCSTGYLFCGFTLEMNLPMTILSMAGT